MSIIKKYDGTNFISAYAINHYDGTKQFNDNVKPFNLNAVYFDGNGDSLAISDSDDQNFGSGNFTVEFQMNPASSNPSVWADIIGQWSSGIGNESWFLGWGQGYAMTLLYTTDGNTDLGISSSGQFPTANKQQHIAAVRNGTSLSLYVDGTVIASHNCGSSVLYNSSKYLQIGCRASENNYYYQGYLANIRISKGIARYTSTFIPTNIIPELDSYTKLLITGESPISDRSGKSITVNGNTTTAKTLSTVYTTSNNAIYFDGDGDQISSADSDDQHFGADDFCVEGQFKFPTLSYPQDLFAQYESNNNRFLFQIINNTVSFGYLNGGTFQVSLATSGILVVDKQYHLALSRSGNSFSIFVDGTSQASTTSSYNFPNIGGNVYIGVDLYNGSPYYHARYYFNNLRVSKGIARYTSNFNAYRTKLSVDSYTKLLITGESPITDKSGKSLSISGNTSSVKVFI